jgi:chorismate dehydratase
MRISAISYLNTAPLMWDFEHGRAQSEFEITYTVPSQCAAELACGSADIGIVPSAAYASISDLSILPGIAIAAKRAVRSIVLISRKPIEEVRSVALDSSSLTSVALTRILFEKHWRSKPVFSSHPPALQNMLAANDAALLIGDPALKVNRTNYQTWDLAEEWIRFTNKPFVFAFWAVRRQALKSTSLELASIFQQSRDHGLEAKNLSEIARVWAPRVQLSEPDVSDYLSSSIYYYLDDACLEGLRLFYGLAADCNVLPHARELHFVSRKPALI